jgi:ubiquinone/menaquinone biosynthesis C-methylase UbiE
MADKIHTSQREEGWSSYWDCRSIESQLSFCETDALLSIFAQYLPIRGKVLEAGCGLGKWVIYLQKTGIITIGIDGNLGCLKRIKEFDKNCKVGVGEVSKLPFKDKSIDAYISLGVVEHFEDGPLQALREAERVLKPGGVAIIEVPYLNFLRRFVLPFKLIFRIVRRRIGKTPQDYYFSEFRYTGTELADFLKKSGFTVKEILPKDDNHPHRNIGLWLDFPFVRRKGRDDSCHELNIFGRILSGMFNKISPWISCACVVCVGFKSSNYHKATVAIGDNE